MIDRSPKTRSSRPRLRPFVTVALVVLICLGGTVWVPQTTLASPNPELTEITYDEESIAQQTNETLYLWQADPTNVTVQISTPLSSQWEVCLTAVHGSNVTRTTIACSNGPKSSISSDIRATGSSAYIERTIVEKFTLNATEKNAMASPNGTGLRALTVSISDSSTNRTGIDVVNHSAVLVTREGDLDGDGLTNGAEASAGTRLDQQDSDTDGLIDSTEIREYHTDPLSSDTDDDNLNDAKEINGETNATAPDSDNDSLVDGAEVNEFGTDPTDPDSDDDGLDDGLEVTKYETDPNIADSDDDGLIDGREIAIGTDPLIQDSDDDGVLDGREVAIGTDPLATDTDGDLLSDGTELTLGTDPTNNLTTLLLLVGFLVTILAILTLMRSRSVSIPDVRVPTLLEQSNATQSTSPSGAVTNDGGITVEQQPPPLLSDEQRVKRLLEDEGGRLRQSDIIEETDWSKSKVSRLLTRMEETDDIQKIHVGRENLIALEDQVPDGVKSPFEE